MTLIRSALILIVAVTTGAAQNTLDRLRSELSSPVPAPPLPVAQELVPETGRRSPATAAFYSLLVPGMGEWYAGRFDIGRYSLIAEGTLWLSYYSLQRYGSWIRDDARSFAVIHAGASLAGKDDQYFVDLGNFMDTEEYNAKKLTDRMPELLYDPDAGYRWRWDSDVKRREYRSMRVAGETVFNTSKFVIGAVVVNHLISAVNAVRLAKQHNDGLTDGAGAWRLESSVTRIGERPDGITVSVVRTF